jgi:hypothetical protein
MGFEAVAVMRRMPELSQVPIIAVSASVLEMDQDQSRRVGCDDFLSKPIEISKVFAMLQQYLGLEWVYGEQAPGADAAQGAPAGEEPADAELVPPPREELELLYELARFGNMARIQEYTRELEDRSPTYRAFARRLNRLAEGFEDEQIQTMLKQYLF